MAFAIVNFYYFRTYDNKIDVFIFGLRDDDTLAVLTILWQDYPILIALFCSLMFGFVCVMSSNICMKLSTKWQRNKIQKILWQISLIILLIIAARGSLGHIH